MVLLCSSNNNNNNAMYYSVPVWSEESLMAFMLNTIPQEQNQMLGESSTPTQIYSHVLK